MKSKFLLLLLVGLSFMSCERVAPNYYGVLMENFGKNGKDDYSPQQGRVWVATPGVELFQIPAWEQRAEFTNDAGQKRVLHMKDANNTEFKTTPLYSYKAIKSKSVDLVFQNAQLGSGNDFMKRLEDNILEPRIYDIIKEESKRYTTEELMATGGSLKFEQNVQELVRKEFEEVGLELMTFSLTLQFTDKVTSKIDQRNEVNTNLSVLDQQIEEQKKVNELAKLQAEYNLIRSSGITDKLLKEQAIAKWNGVIYGETPFFLKDL